MEKDLTQYIRPPGFEATRFGFDSQLSTNSEHELSKLLGVACDKPAVELVESTGGVRHA